MGAGLQGGYPGRRGVLEQARHQVDGLGRCSCAKNLLPGVRLDLRELELGVVGVHLLDLLASRGAQDLDNLDELVDARVTGENGLAQHKLCKDAAGAPHVDVGRVVGSTEDELGCTVISRANVRDVGLAADEVLRTPEVAEFQNARVRVEEQVLRLDISMADALRVDVGKASKQLVHVQLDEGPRDGLLAFRVLSCHLVHCFRDELEHEVEVYFVLLLSRRVEKIHEFDDVAVLEAAHDLKLAILETLVLQDLFDRHHLSSFTEFGLVHNTEAAIADDLRKEGKQANCEMTQT